MYRPKSARRKSCPYIFLELSECCRLYRLKIYKQCFVGEEAVKWMVDNGVAEGVPEAVQLGNQLMRQGLLQHVTAEHAFENKFLYYRFVSFDENGEDQRPMGSPAAESRYSLLPLV